MDQSNKHIHIPQRAYRDITEGFLFVPEDDQIRSNFELFAEVLAKQLTQTETVLGNKGKEYSKGADRFSNFKDAARIEQTTPEKALLGMMVKHEVSVRDIVDSIEARLPTEAVLDEKIGDWVAYLILLKGLITERIKNA